MSRLVEITVPKFKFESQFSLRGTLAQMEMPDAFELGANFSGMTESPGLFIGDVLHKAFVAVDEEGTEAAAATGVVEVEVGKEIGGPEPIVMRLDRPFLFLIRDNSSGTIVFVGRLLNPKT